MAQMTAGPAERRKGPRTGDPELRGRRTEPRAIITLPASAEAISGNRNVKLLEVSRSGARLEGDGIPAAGKDVLIRCGRIEAFGAVAWAKAGRCGIHFDEALSLKDLFALRALSNDAEMSDERQAAADWASGLAR
jgi:hypothetical protein